MKKTNIKSHLLSIKHLDNYHIKNEIYEFIETINMSMYGIVIDMGCGDKPYGDVFTNNQNILLYCGIDILNSIYDKPDVYWDGSTAPVKDSSADFIIATELFEHIPHINTFLDETNRILRTGGKLIFTTPFFWPLHDAPNDQYRFTPFSLNRLLANSGFIEISIHSFGGWDASLAQMIALWVRRRPRLLFRNFWTLLLTPLIYCLYKIDKPPEIFRSQLMLTGLYGYARKA